MKFYAHTATKPDGQPDPDTANWQPLSAHLRNSTAPRATENHVIPVFLKMVFDRPTGFINNLLSQ